MKVLFQWLRLFQWLGSIKLDRFNEVMRIWESMLLRTVGFTLLVLVLLKFMWDEILRILGLA